MFVREGELWHEFSVRDVLLWQFVRDVLVRGRCL